jgi:hypothetical protein
MQLPHVKNNKVPRQNSTHALLPLQPSYLFIDIVLPALIGALVFDSTSMIAILSWYYCSDPVGDGSYPERSLEGTYKPWTSRAGINQS